jgi:RNA-directed DNA polymerase
LLREGVVTSSIFHEIVSTENLFRAWRKFSKGKKKKHEVMSFSLNLENNIFELEEKMVAHEWACGGYTSFSIQDPKPRKIHKATVCDRVLYQAVYQVLYPLFDKTFIYDSYASRNGKGTHAGIARLVSMACKVSQNYKSPCFGLKCDIKKFFDSIDHEILLELLKKKIDCPDTLKLLEKIIDSFHKTPGKGLPLGNVTSQLFANVYMNGFDWFAKIDLGAKYYIRYCDDFVILDSSKEALAEIIPLLQKFLGEKLKLEMHPNKISIRSLRQGIDFLGAVVLPYHTVPRTKTKQRIIRKSKKLLTKAEKGLISHEKLKQSQASYLGHLSHTQSRKIRIMRLFRL